MILDTDLVIQRRLELGLSQREVARRIGVTPNFIRSMENGANHNTIDLSTLTQLAEALGVTPRNLFFEPEQQEVAHAEPPRRLIALLVAADDSPVSTSHLADIMNINILELMQLLEDSRQRLSDLGMELMVSPTGLDVQLTYDARLVSRAEKKALLRASNARCDISERVARLVHTVITKGCTAREMNASPSGRLLLGQAINAGWIRYPAHEHALLELTNDVKESLQI